VKELQRDHRGAAADRELYGEGADGAARAVDEQRVARVDGELVEYALGRLARGRQRRSRLPGQAGGLGEELDAYRVSGVGADLGPAEHVVADGEAVTPLPTASTVPAASTPGIAGSGMGNIASSKPCRSLPSIGLTPAARTRRRTWPGPGSGTSTSDSCSSP
jgi:hypothetical protein